MMSSEQSRSRKHSIKPKSRTPDITVEVAFIDGRSKSVGAFRSDDGSGKKKKKKRVTNMATAPRFNQRQYENGSMGPGYYHTKTPREWWLHSPDSKSAAFTSKEEREIFKEKELSRTDYLDPGMQSILRDVKRRKSGTMLQSNVPRFPQLQSSVYNPDVVLDPNEKHVKREYNLGASSLKLSEKRPDVFGGGKQNAYHLPPGIYHAHSNHQPDHVTKKFIFGQVKVLKKQLEEEEKRYAEEKRRYQKAVALAESRRRRSVYDLVDEEMDEEFASEDRDSLACVDIDRKPVPRNVCVNVFDKVYQKF
jgi:hypothetical protein